MQLAGEWSRVEVGRDSDGAGRLRLGHSNRGRAERASGKARVGRGQNLAVGCGQRHPGAQAFLGRG